MPTPAPIRRRYRAFALVAPLAFAATLTAGCATSEKWIERRSAPSSFGTAINWFGNDEPAAAPATLSLAAKHALDPSDEQQREQLIDRLERQSHAELSPETEFALSELAAIEADALVKDAPDRAIGYYAESLIHGHRALSADPDRRVAGSTERYNQTLEALLRVMRERDQVRPGARVDLPVTHAACSIAVELHSRRWRREDFQRFEFAEDYQVLGLRNHYHKSGVGVPLIAIRLHPDRDHLADKYYPRKLCYPLTAFMRVEGCDPTQAAGPSAPVRLVLELHDPTDHETLEVAGKRLPLESDLTTPLAYYLDQPDLHEREVSTLGLLEPEKVEQLQGLYMLEPFDPKRIPVVMVHGLWSSPATWMEMFNDLRSDPRVSGRYQFWFYLYPTGNPFWVSAAQMRNDLAALRQELDPHRRMRPLDQTVLVGHSMGGLLSRLQTVESGPEFWQIVSDRRFQELDADPEVKQYLSDLFFFQPDPSVRRVVTIGSPHRGSRFANGVTQWLGAKLIAMPMRQMAKRQELFQRNPGFFRPHVAARVMTSIDSLSPDSPMLAALLAARSGPWVEYHNVVGDARRSGVTRWLSSRGDGIVSLESARLDDLPRLTSQIVVPEDHLTLHRHPQSIEEVRRVLLMQLAELTPRRLAHDAPPPAIRPTPPVTPAPGIHLVSGHEER